MKKLVCLVLALMMISSYAFAEDLGVQVIGGDRATMNIVRIADMKLDERYEIDGYAAVMPRFCGFFDSFAEYGPGMAGDNTQTSWHWDKDGSLHFKNDGDERGRHISNYVACSPELKSQPKIYQHMYWQDSGKNADYLWLQVDIVNKQSQPYMFMENTSVKVVYNNEYEFSGWIRQTNDDYHVGICRIGYDGQYAGDVMINPADEEAINTLYTGRYAIGCTLPTEVINSEDPLRIEIRLGGNKLTYHIRK